MLEISETGIATSGISRKNGKSRKKFHHLVNPKDPNHFSYELRTVTVIAQNTEKRRRTGENTGADGKRERVAICRKKQNRGDFFGL